MKKEVITHKDSKSPISEIFRTLRTNIQFMSTNKKLEIIQVTSTFPGEGKSWVASNLAVAFAQTGKKVILIDADMRKGRQYAIFGVSPRPGLSNYLSEIYEKEKIDLAEYIQETEIKNLYLISSGNIPPNPSELLVSSQMVGLLEKLKEICDIAIVDGTPCELVTDSIILARLVDSSIIVTAHKETKKDALERVVKNIQNVGGKIAGVVINKILIDEKRYNNKYYYYGEKSIDSKNRKKNKNSVLSNKNERKRKELKVRTENSVNDLISFKDPVKVKPDKQEELPKSLHKELEVENKEQITIDKTNDILTQINEYLNQEKTKLKKGE